MHTCFDGKKVGYHLTAHQTSVAALKQWQNVSISLLKALGNLYSNK